MESTAATIRLGSLEQLWGASGHYVGGSGSHESHGSHGSVGKRTARLLDELQQLSKQPHCGGAEVAAWEVCRLLEAGRERDLHSVRTAPPPLRL